MKAPSLRFVVLVACLALGAAIAWTFVGRTPPPRLAPESDSATAAASRETPVKAPPPAAAPSVAPAAASATGESTRTALRTANSLFVHVVGHDGAPVGDVPLVVRLAEERLLRPGRPLGTTDADGTLRIDDFVDVARRTAGLRKTNAFVVAVAAPGFDHVTAAVDRTALPEAPLQLRLEPFGSLVVTARAPDGGPVAAAITVKATPHRPGLTRLHGADALPDAPATFGMAGLGRTFDIEVKIAGEPIQRKVVGPRVPGEVVTVTIDQPLVWLVGRLANAPPGPPQFVKLDIRGPRSTSGLLDQGGHFRIALHAAWHDASWSKIGFDATTASGGAFHVALPEFTVGSSGIVDVGTVSWMRAGLLVAGVVVGASESLVVSAHEIGDIDDDAARVAPLMRHGADDVGWTIAQVPVDSGSFRITARSTGSTILVRALRADGTVVSRAQRVAVGTTGVVLEALTPGRLTLIARVEAPGPLSLVAWATGEDGTATHRNGVQLLTQLAGTVPVDTQFEFPSLLPGRHLVTVRAIQDVPIEPFAVEVGAGEHVTRVIRVTDERVPAAVSVGAEGVADADVHGALVVGVPPNATLVRVHSGAASMKVARTGTPATLFVRGRAPVGVTLMPGEQRLTGGDALDFGVDVVVAPPPTTGVRCVLSFRWLPEPRTWKSFPDLHVTNVEIPVTGRARVELPFPGTYAVWFVEPRSGQAVTVGAGFAQGVLPPLTTVTVDGSPLPPLELAIPK